MAEYGLGNFKYDITVSGNAANFKFYDPEDVTNTAEVSVGDKDFPESVKDPDSREVAELAFAQCAKALNEKRDERTIKEKQDELQKQQDKDAHARTAAQDFFDKSEDGAVAPLKIESDGTRVYNTAPPEDKKTDKDDKK